MSYQRKALRSVAVLAIASCLLMGMSLALAGDDSSKERAWLGVVLSQESDGPVKIIDVVEGSPAEAAGLQKGDVVLTIDGSAIGDSGDVVRAIRDHGPGDSVTLEVRGEDGAKRSHAAVLEGRKARAYSFTFNGTDFDLDLGNLDETMAELRERFGDGEGFNWIEEPRAYLGIGLIQPSDELRQALGALEGEGVLIDSVEDASPAAEAGLRAGDFLVSVDGEKVSSTSALTSLIRSRQPGTSVSLGIVRDRAPMTLSATLGEAKSRVFMFKGDGEGEGRQGSHFGPREFIFRGLGGVDA